jgi:hypothetical protein
MRRGFFRETRDRAAWVGFPWSVAPIASDNFLLASRREVTASAIPIVSSIRFTKGTVKPAIA